MPPLFMDFRTSAVLRSARPTVMLYANGNGAPEPEGGWAPPPWKRKVTSPMESLTPGQKLKGKVRNVEDFGAFGMDA